MYRNIAGKIILGSPRYSRGWLWIARRDMTALKEEQIGLVDLKGERLRLLEYGTELILKEEVAIHCS